MMGVKSIVFEKNGRSLVISIGNVNEILYHGISKTIGDEVIFKYLESFFRIIEGWKKEYLDFKTIDGTSWKLSISYIDDSKKEFYGKSNFPSNFEALERINQALINEVQNGY